MRRKQRGVVTSVKKVMQCGPMPETHQSEREKKTQVGLDLIIFEPLSLYCGEEKSHVNVVTKPERKRDVPAVPEIANIVRQKRAIEVLRRADSTESAKPDGERTVTGKVKKQIETVPIHVQRDLAERSARCLVDPETFDQGGQNEFVEKPAERPFDREVEITQEILS